MNVRRFLTLGAAASVAACVLMSGSISTAATSELQKPGKAEGGRLVERDLDEPHVRHLRPGIDGPEGEG